MIFSTKNRYPFIHKEIEDELFAYIGGIIKNLNGIPFIIKGIHINILVGKMVMECFQSVVQRN
ncbi:hypothetical protein FACS189428_0200 [Clostridia bacterium]|nr:hypothetical protein FACS189428_0200 [Clostridia bacterium]